MKDGASLGFRPSDFLAAAAVDHRGAFVISPGNQTVRGSGARKLTVATAAPPALASSVPFYIYLLYLISFFFHFGGRYPVVAPLRPDLVLAVLVILSLLPAISARMSLLSRDVSRALLMLVAWVVVSLPFVEWPGSVIRENWQPFFKAVLFFYFTILTVDTERRLKVFLVVFIGCQVVRVLEPLHLHLTEGYFGSATHLGGGEFAQRLAGAPSDVINPNGLGFVIAGCIPFLHFLLFASRSKVLQLVYLALVPAFLYALILTMSRGGFIALLVAAWLIFLQSKRKGGMVIAGLVVAVLAWQSMSDVQKDRYLSLVSSDTQQSGSAQGRWRGMIGEFELGLTNPIFGYGVGTTPEAKANILGDTQAAHNLYAELLIEVGVVGAFFFLQFMFRVRSSLKSNLEQLSQFGEDNERVDFLQRLNRALVAAFWVYAVYSINYYGLSQDYWYILGGLAVAYSRVLYECSREAEREIPTT